MAHHAPFDDGWSEALLANWTEARLGRTNASSAQNRHNRHNDDDDAHFRRCWARQDCGGCLDQTACSWCPFSATCVPNNFPVPALAPAFDDMVCPYWAERWELRTNPLGCQVSTITSVTAIVAGSCTLVVTLLILIILWSVRWARGLWRARQKRLRELRIQRAQQARRQQEDAFGWRPVMWFTQNMGDDTRSVSEASMSPDVQPTRPHPPIETMPIDERTPLLVT